MQKLVLQGLHGHSTTVVEWGKTIEPGYSYLVLQPVGQELGPKEKPATLFKVREVVHVLLLRVHQ